MTFRSTRLAAAGLAATLLLGSAVPANARDNWGPAAAGLLGGLVIGGAIASASRPAYAYPPPYGYAPQYGYAPPAYGYAPPAAYAPPAVVYAPPTVYTAPTAYASANPHVDWCYANRPGYYAADNTFPSAYGGARENCQSPYGY